MLAKAVAAYKWWPPGCLWWWHGPGGGGVAGGWRWLAHGMGMQMYNLSASYSACMLLCCLGKIKLLVFHWIKSTAK